MKKYILPIVALFFLSTCGSHVNSFKSPFSHTWDSEAVKNQKLMMSVVEITFHSVAQYLSIDEEQKMISVKSTIVKWGASGVVIVSDKRGTLIATNAHVCGTRITKPLVFLNPTLTVMDISGEKHESKIIYSDVHNDLCFIVSKDNFGQPVSIRTKKVPVGANVIRIGADFGVFGRELSYISHGTYMGSHDIPEEFLDKDDLPSRKVDMFSMVTSSGGSGGPVFYDGELINIVYAVRGIKDENAALGHITVAIQMKDIYNGIVKSQELWK